MNDGSMQKMTDHTGAHVYGQFFGDVVRLYDISSGDFIRESKPDDMRIGWIVPGTGDGKSFMHRSADSNYFPTPYSMTEQLLEKEQFDYMGSCLEPAAGCGHMVKVLEKKFRRLYSYDLQDGTDFYKENRQFDYVITNPPYGKEADLFVRKAKTVATSKIAMLLRTNYLSGQARSESDIFHQLRRVYVFTRMADLRSPIREDGKYSTAGIVYAWFIWEIGYTGKPELDWIDNQKFVLNKGDK